MHNTDLSCVGLRTKATAASEWFGRSHSPCRTTTPTSAARTDVQSNICQVYLLCIRLPIAKRKATGRRYKTLPLMVTPNTRPVTRFPYNPVAPAILHHIDSHAVATGKAEQPGSVTPRPQRGCPRGSTQPTRGINNGQTAMDHKERPEAPRHDMVKNEVAGLPTSGKEISRDECNRQV